MFVLERFCDEELPPVDRFRLRIEFAVACDTVKRDIAVSMRRISLPCLWLHAKGALRMFPNAFSKTFVIALVDRNVLIVFAELLKDDRCLPKCSSLFASFV